MKKKILISIAALLLIIMILSLVILIPTIKNKNYEEKLLEDIYLNTSLENITYVNKDNNYYIIKTENNVVVLDLNFEEVYTKESVRESNLPLVYKRNNLYYEEKVVYNDKITYNYYSTDEDLLIFSSFIGGH